MVRGKTFHVRLRLSNGSILNTCKWGHDVWQTQTLLQKRCPPCLQEECGRFCLRPLLPTVRRATLRPCSASAAMKWGSRFLWRQASEIGGFGGSGSGGSDATGCVGALKPYRIKNAIVIIVMALLTGCSGGMRPGRSKVQATAQSLVGRWDAVPKDVYDESPGAREVTGPGLERAHFRYVFNSDQTYVMSVHSSVGKIAALEQHGSINGMWKVVDIQGNRLIIELPEHDLKPRITVAFQTEDRCTYDMGNEEVLILTRAR
jgi:hypothetical protein